MLLVVNRILTEKQKRDHQNKVLPYLLPDKASYLYGKTVMHGLL